MGHATTRSARASISDRCASKVRDQLFKGITRLPFYVWHTNQVSITDASIILELGHTNPGRTEDEKAAYSEGLKNLLEQLKNQGVVAAEEIAPAVLSFRREYQSDPTRILNL